MEGGVRLEDAGRVGSGLVLRGALGGVLMGLANLVPGISGGTMLLAAGIYPRFISAIAEVTTLRFRVRSLVVLGSVLVSAAVAILVLAGPIKDLVVTQRWIMYSLFIGLTLGGVPVVWRMARPGGGAVWSGAACGFLVMLVLTLLRELGATASVGEPNGLLLGMAGLAGASAMILPGVSGGYLLLLLGQYVPILSAIDAFEKGIRNGDAGAILEPALDVMLPVGIGVVAGIVVVSNLLRWLLRRFEKLTLGVLLGLLLGAVIGLWPFQEGMQPIPGETVIKGRLVTAENWSEFAPEEYPTVYFRPSAPQAAASLLLVAIGVGFTSLVARIGKSGPPDRVGSSRWG